MEKRELKQKHTEEELIARLQKGDHYAFTALYSYKFHGLVLLSVKYVKDTAVAEEIVQDIFLKIWENPADISNVKSLNAYLYRSVINQSINYVNRQKNINQHHIRIAEENKDEYVESAIEDYGLKALLYKEIENLPEQCKKVFKMSRFDDLKYREIAEKLNITEKTVENHIVNALKILRSRLHDQNENTTKDPLRLKLLLMLMGL